MRDNMKGSKVTASGEERRCMVLTSNKKLREKLLPLLLERDMVVYTPDDVHDASGYLYENYIDFLVIDVDCWDKRNWDYPGFEFAYKIRENFGYVRKPIIFLSNDEGGKLYAYENFNCTNYILKPVDEKPFMMAVNKALIFSEKTFLKDPRYIKSNSVYFSFYFDETMYIGVHKKNVYFHMQDGGDIQVGSRYLHYYAEEAKKHGFMQVRRDIMVNTRYIANVDFNSKIITLDGGVELGIGDAYRSALEGYVKRYELETVVKK